MYIMNERSGAIINSNYVAEFFLTKTSDSTLLSLRWNGIEKLSTLERYKNYDEAMDALCSLMRALEAKQLAFYVPASLYYFEESVKKDARVKRKGGS